ncbi:MAG: hypothetical protein D6785_06360, partial [Planctomycetota bacterium]
MESLKEARILFISDQYPPYSEDDRSLSAQRLAKQAQKRCNAVEILTFSSDLALGTVTTEIDD